MAGFLNGPGFERMRDDLRRSCRDIWVIDCSPEGHQPDVSTRIFQGVQQPVCVVLAARILGGAPEQPARVRFRALPKGRREEKFAALGALSLSDSGWEECPTEWRAPFLPESGDTWGDFPRLEDLFLYNGSGIMPGRTWVIAPDAASLRDRWAALTRERDRAKKELLFHPHMNGDKTVTKGSTKGLPGHEYRAMSVDKDTSPCIAPTRYGFRSFDRQWIIPDNRLINRPNPTLWDYYSEKQLYITAPEDRTPTAGPSITLTSLIPDLHHYHGRGGRAFPLWSDRAASRPNLKSTLLAYLSAAFGQVVGAEDLMAYLAAVMAHPAFTTRFAADLVRPGLRVPITADAGLFALAADIGREVVWLHTFGERFPDPAAGRPAGPPRLPPAEAPTIPAAGAIPGAPELLPDVIDYDGTSRRLRVGRGFIDNVSPAVWNYEVSGKHVLHQWFSYRKLDRSRPIIGDRRPPSPLDKIQPASWPAEYTTELMNLIHVLGRLVALEPRQAALLDRILASPVLDDGTMKEACAFALPGGDTGSRQRTDDPSPHD